MHRHSFKTTRQRLIPLSPSSVDRLVRMIRRGRDFKEIASHRFLSTDGKFRCYPPEVLSDIAAQEAHRA
jgi:hypothetical protein